MGNVSCNAYFPITTSIKEITQKLQLTGIKSTVSPAVENIFSDNINIYTDETSVMYAEEATASPSDITAQKKFDNIGKQEFSDEILYRKKKSGVKKSLMSVSTMSIGSSNSDEFNNPAAMSKSIHVIPTERNEESITQEIECKEKLLADVLKLNIVPVTEKSVNGTSSLVETRRINKEKNELKCNPLKPNIQENTRDFQFRSRNKEIKESRQSSSKNEVKTLSSDRQNCISKFTNEQKSPVKEGKNFVSISNGNHSDSDKCQDSLSKLNFFPGK